MKNSLFPRIVLSQIEKFIKTKDIVVLHGARQVGKTSLLQYLIQQIKNQGQKTYYIDLEHLHFLELLENGVEACINHLKQQGFKLKTNKVYLFIDEIQYLKNPSNFLKLMHDHHSYIKLIISGSSSFEIKNKFQDSLVGRTVNFEIFPLSFEEFLIFKKQNIDLKKTIDTITQTKLKTLFQEYALFGGYPKIVLHNSIEVKEKYLQQIIDTYVRKDIKDLANIKDILKFNKLLQVLAAQSGCLLNIKELANTVGIHKNTIENYLFLLENTYIIKRIYPYANNIRSELFKTPKIFFYDTGLMHMLKFKNLPHVLEGQTFETSIFAELVKYFGLKNINYWRTQDKKEIDFILYTKNNKIIPIEAKLNANNLKKTALNYFIKKYKLNNWYCVSPENQGKSKYYLYPWELKKFYNN